MSPPSETPSSQPVAANRSSRPPEAGFLHALFRHAEEIYFYGGVVLVLIGAGPVANSPPVYYPNAGFAGLGLCVAGGLCFVASAIVHRGNSAKQP